MPLCFISGVGFDARHEIEALIEKLCGVGHVTPPLLAIIDLRSSLKIGETYGLKAIRHKWFLSRYNNLFAYTDSDVIGAIHAAPGTDGQTETMTFLGVSHVTDGLSLEKQNSFHESMHRRLTEGTRK